MRIGRVVHRRLLGVGLIGLLAFAGGCGGGGEVALPPGDKSPGDQIKANMEKAYGGVAKRPTAAKTAKRHN